MNRFALLFACLALGASCSSGTPASPSPGSGSTGGNQDPPPPLGPPSISLTANGLSPREVTIDRGGTVRLVNNDTRVHDLMGGLDPQRPECPEIVSFLTPGQSREAGPFATAGVCNFHSHAFVGIPEFQGKITIR